MQLLNINGWLFLQWFDDCLYKYIDHMPYNDALNYCFVQVRHEMLGLLLWLYKCIKLHDQAKGEFLTVYMATWVLLPLYHIFCRRVLFVLVRWNSIASKELGWFLCMVEGASFSPVMLSSCIGQMYLYACKG